MASENTLVFLTDTGTPLLYFVGLSVLVGPDWIAWEIIKLGLFLVLASERTNCEKKVKGG